MQYYRSEIKVGVFVFVSLIILMVFVLSIGSFQLFQSTKKIHVFFDFVNGLEINAPVRYSGVKIGKVSKVEIIEDLNELPDKTKKVKVTMSVEDNVNIGKSTKILVNTLGLLGEKYIELSPNETDTEFLKDGDVLKGEDVIEVQELLSITRSIAQKLEHIVSNIDAMIGSDETRNTVQEVIKKLHMFAGAMESLSTDMSGIISGNKDAINDIIVKADSLVTNLEMLSKNSNDVVAENKDDIKDLISNLKETSAYAKTFAKKISKSPSTLIWKSKEDRDAELEEKKAKAKAEGKVLDDKGRAFSPREMQVKGNKGFLNRSVK